MDQFQCTAYQIFDWSFWAKVCHQNYLVWFWSLPEPSHTIVVTNTIHNVRLKCKLTWQCLIAGVFFCVFFYCSNVQFHYRYIVPLYQKVTIFFSWKQCFYSQMFYAIFQICVKYANKVKYAVLDGNISTVFRNESEHNS